MSFHPNRPIPPPASPPQHIQYKQAYPHLNPGVTACRQDYRHCLNINHVLIDGIPAHPLFVCSLLWLFLLFAKEKKKRKHMCYLFITVDYRIRYKRTLLETAEAGSAPLDCSSSGDRCINSWK